MNTTGMFLAAAVEAVKPDPLSALIAAVAIAAVFMVFILIKKQTKRPETTQPLAQQAEEVVEAVEERTEHIHFYKPEEIGVDDGELIAVLTAAIVAATGKSSSTFRVVSFRKKGDWAGNALRELINK